MSRRERGDGKLSLIIFLVVIAAGIYFLIQWVPPRVNAYEFKDEMTRWNTDPSYRMRRVDADTIKAELMQKAQQLDLPINPKNLQVSTSGEGTVIRVVFDVPIDLKVTTITQHYEFKEPRS